MANLPNLNKPDQSAATHASDFAVVVPCEDGANSFSIRETFWCTSSACFWTNLAARMVSW